MQIKKELIVGIIGLFAIIGITVYYAKSYTDNRPQIIPVTQNSSVQPSTTLTQTEIAKHNSSSDCWIIVNQSVYQVTDYLIQHPDGGKIILPYCGGDATSAYETKAGRGTHSSRANADLFSLKLGSLNETVSSSTQIIVPTRKPIQLEEDEDE